ncbi:MAG: amidohydrolase family protein [Candidatus Bathyarchaeia archaeon]
MTKTLRNVIALCGPNLKVTPGCTVKIDRGRFSSIGVKVEPSSGEVYDAAGFILIPGLINAHVHIGDAAAKDRAAGLSLEDFVDPWRGVKHKVLTSTPPKDLIRAMRDAVDDMLRCGITTFADFREGGLAGIRLLRSALAGSRIRCIKLGRPNHYFTRTNVVKRKTQLPREAYEELDATLGVCEGLGLSGPNEFTDASLGEMRQLVESTGKIAAIHAAEARSTVEFSTRTFGKTEVERAVQKLRPQILVHLTHASARDLSLADKAGCSVVCCPRANAALRVGIPPIEEMLKRGLNVALGTDNVMVTGPDLFREMDYTLRTIQAHSSVAIPPREILKMITINAARALRIDNLLGSVDVGKRADAVVLKTDSLNMRPVNDIYASIVHRARPEDIAAVISEGEVVWGELSNLA